MTSSRLCSLVRLAELSASESGRRGQVSGHSFRRPALGNDCHHHRQRHGQFNSAPGVNRGRAAECPQREVKTAVAAHNGDHDVAERCDVPRQVAQIDPAGSSL